MGACESRSGHVESLHLPATGTDTDRRQGSHVVHPHDGGSCTRSDDTSCCAGRCESCDWGDRKDIQDPVHRCHRAGDHKRVRSNWLLPDTAGDEWKGV